MNQNEGRIRINALGPQVFIGGTWVRCTSEEAGQVMMNITNYHNLPAGELADKFPVRKANGEANPCRCNHGLARHSDKPAGVEKGKIGYLCFVTDCGCYNYQPAPQEYQFAAGAGR